MALLSTPFHSLGPRTQRVNQSHDRSDTRTVTGCVLQTLGFCAEPSRQRGCEHWIRQRTTNDRRRRNWCGVICRSFSMDGQDAGVSRRANVLMPEEGGAVSPYYQGWREAQNNAYDESTNPSGCIQLGLAENKLSLDMLEHWLATHNTLPTPEQEDILGFKAIAGYPDVYHGLWVFRSVLAHFITEVCGNTVQFEPDRMVATTGATAAIELVTFAVADPGDAFLLLSPAYPGFDRDIGYRSQVSLVPVQTSSENNFLVTRDGLEQALYETEHRGQKVKGILMTSPSNPIGTTYDREYLLLILKFIQEKNIHLVCDEIYGGSDFAGPGFVSVAELVNSPLMNSDKVHIVSGLSKVLGIPGFRVGWLYSWNDRVLDATKNLTRFSSIATHTQQLIVALLSDTEFIREYLSDNRRKLRERWHLVRDGLLDAGIDFIESTAGLFCWVNLTNLFLADTGSAEQRELDLWNRLLYDVGINVTPGCSCHCNEGGWFRLCFAFVDDKEILAALDRLRQFAATVEREKLSRAKYV